MAGTELASAYISLFPKLKTNEIEAQLKGVKVDGAGKAAGTSFGTSFGKAFKTLAGAWIVKEAAQAFISLGNAALDAYGQFEQLEGGVKKLFGDEAAKTVQAYAANAFETAGMSANQYMETVTGFSGALLRSLGNDTQAAAEMANMAISDMSDIANTYGMSLDVVKDTYQSLARGNYQTLDNLFGGMFAGTKTGLRDMLDYAEQYRASLGETVSYSESSYADIVAAIHDVSMATGVYGTTQAEAAKTIQGSLNMAKAAWQNWLTGLANENANLEELTNQLIDSVVTAASNILPRIMQILTAVGAALVTQLPVVLGEINTALSAGGVDMMSAALDLFGSIITALLQATPQILQALLLMLASLVVAVVNKAIEMAQAGIEMLKGLAQGVKDGFSFVLSEIGRGIEDGIQKIKDKIEAFVQVGKDLIAGLARGIKASPVATTAMGEVGNALLAKANSVFERRSPSKKFMAIGNDLMEGLAIGIKNKASNAVDAVSNVSHDMLGAASFSATPQVAAAGVGYGSTTINLYCDIKDLQGIQTLTDLYGMLSRARAINPTRR